MLSLIFNIAKYIVGYKSSDQSMDKDIDNVLAYLEDIKKGHNELEQQLSLQTFNENEYFYTTGKVTFMNDEYILVDDRYPVSLTNIFVGKPMIGDKVYYLAHKADKHVDQKIYKIISVIDDSWDNCDTTLQQDIIKVQTLTRTVVGQVTKKDGRKVFINDHNICIDLNDVNSEFIPIVGDWLKLEALVEVDEDVTNLSGEIIKVHRIHPLRSNLNIGVVSSYDEAKGTGTVNKNILFYKSACESGYVPHVGDKVVCDSIESDQNFCTWRSLTLVPLFQNNNEKSPAALGRSLRSDISDVSKNIDMDDLLKDKYGITITSNLEVTLNIHEQKDIFVSIQNKDSTTHILNRGYFMLKKAQSQLSLISPDINPNIIIKPLEIISYQFRCNPKFIGTSEELFIFSFRGFQIGRIFKITINAKNTSECKTINRFYKKSSYNPIIEDDSYVPGIRPCKPPAFIKVRNGVFKVPRHYWDMVLNLSSKDRTQAELEMAIGNAIPCLTEKLSFETYRDHFHALLYLEEIDQTINIQQYDMDAVSMRCCGEYLAMTVLGLAEKRPSLLVGDKAIVSFKWDNSQGKLKYEGYIHKTTSTEIFLKFNSKFHQDYNGEDCHVTFRNSTTTIQRCHNAVNLAVAHLKSDFLFPTCVISKDPQMILVESEDEQNPNSEIKESEGNDSFSNSNVTLFDKSFLHDGIKPISRTANIKACLENYKDIKSVNANINVNNINNSPDNSIQNSLLEACISQVRKRKLIWFNKNLNYYQKEAVRNILKGVARPLPYVIFGPPGTGKTMTLCESILQILTTLPESRLLVATPSNSSANLIAERLLDSEVLKPGDLIRLVAHHCLSDNSIPEILLPYCATADISVEKAHANRSYINNQGTKISCPASVLGRHRITVGTCSGLGVLHNLGFARNHFTHVLVDEAGQATEPEIMIPLSFIHFEEGQVVLAGDPMQLGPVVESKLAKHFGLGESFLTRLLHQFPYQRDPEGFEHSYDPRLITKLIVNYRSLPEILELPNSLFYRSELQAKICPKNSEEAKLLQSVAEYLPEREGLPPPAILFHGINGENFRDYDSPSWYNPEEATQAYLYLLQLYKQGVCPDDIGVITPYYRQVLQIRNLLLELNIQCPKVSTVEGFQGQERKIIILSAVRSSRNLIDEDIKYALGFVASPRRLNVAITRARALLIILGNPNLLAQDPYWRSVLKYCIDHDCYTGYNSLSFALNDYHINRDIV